MTAEVSREGRRTGVGFEGSRPELSGDGRRAGVGVEGSRPEVSSE